MKKCSCEGQSQCFVYGHMLHKPFSLNNEKGAGGKKEKDNKMISSYGIWRVPEDILKIIFWPHPVAFENLVRAPPPTPARDQTHIPCIGK